MSEVGDAELLARAAAVRERAYARYSDYRVGAALRGEDGRIFEGVNVENVTYGLTVCAERSAVLAAVTAGVLRFSALAVVTEDGGMPCGLCRQTLREFGRDLPILVADAAGHVRRTSLAALLPEAFGPEHLGHRTGG